MTFRISSLADRVSLEVDGVELLLVRRPIPIPSFSTDFNTFRLTKPMKIWHVSIAIYNDPELWSFLTEWNQLPTPSRWLMEFLPAGTLIKYLTISDLRKYYSRKKVPNNHGAGDLDLDVNFSYSSHPLPVVIDPLARLLDELESGTLPGTMVAF